MRRRSEDYDEEAARREPLLRRRSPQPPAADGGGAAAFSRGPSPDRADDGHHSHRTPGTFRLTKRTSTAAQEDEEHQGLVLKSTDDEKTEADVREIEIEVMAGAVAEAVADAVQEAVAEAVHDAVQQAIEENVQFDVRANMYTLVAVTGVILFWRGVWNSWDALFGTELVSNMASMVVGLLIMSVVRAFNLPLVEGLPGG
ncbi:ubiquitin-conjugating enzyme [Micractinium conductrix]|uniref:Ubiquitin-conjugating enzyme n=1 Tax=Micractinium conductrix TaxID=554055 RepID=A0A2P6V3E1_9CHLO|nr:ubiquitin-conjugating enzyme [Micractinium conductrix]|eukprot:PSC68613.1 ubiquitin-conjugating enzyme [Micractinium conductrix]